MSPETTDSSLQVSTSSTPPTQQARALSAVRAQEARVGESSGDSTPVRAVSTGRGRSSQPYALASSRNRSSSARMQALLPPPAYACEVASPAPASQPVSLAPGDGTTAPDVHLHQHVQRIAPELHLHQSRQELHLHGVDSRTHSQAVAAAQLAQAQAQNIQQDAQVFAQNVQHEAQAYVQVAKSEAQAYVQSAVTSAQHEAMQHAQEYAERVRAEAERQVQSVSEQAGQHLAQANETIASLQARNRELEEQQEEMMQRIAMIQAEMQSIKAQQQSQADTSHLHAERVPQASRAQDQNGTEISEALKALAASVGETMKELREIVSPKASKPKSKAKGSGLRNGTPSPKHKSPKVSAAQGQRSAGVAAAPVPNRFGCFCAPRLPVFTGVGLPAPSRSKKGSSSDNPFNVFSTPKPPSVVHPPDPPMHYDIGSEHEEGEEEEEREDDPIIDVTDAPGEEEVDYEQDTYHNKDLRDLKIPALPSTAAGYRAWRNGVLTSFSSIDKSGNARILRWLQVALDPAIGDRQMRNLQVTSDGLPRLDAFLAAQLTDPKHLKGDYGVAAQAFTERAHALGVQPSGRALLAMLSRRFRVDRIRGATVSQQTLLAIQLEGFSQQQLQAFREKVEFCLNGFSPEAWPAESTLFSWLYSKLKHCRLLSRAVDKIKDSNPGSNKRTFAWLWSQLVELLDELREEANEESIRDTLIKPKAKAAPAPKKEERSRDKPDKPTPANPAPPAKTKGSGKDGKDKDGKGKGGKGSGKGADSQKTPNKPKAKSGGKGQGSKAEGKAPSKGNAPKATVPCLFFPKGTCNRGENCPFSHETSPGNKAPGSKTTGASATAKSSAAAVALLLPTTARGASVDGSSTPSKTTFWKRSGLSRFFQFVSGWFTVFSNICAPACPATVTPLLVASQHQHPQQGWFYHEWIADSGAGRSLESREALNEQGIPEDAYAHMAEQAPTVSFSTGNGVVDSGLMLGFEGSILGNNSAYLLDNCPSVKSLGELVETKSMPFVWLPGKLPMFLSSVEHVQVIEESAICADRVEGNVPIFREQVRFVPPSTVAMPGFMSDARKAKPLARTTIEPSRHTTYRPSPHITEESTLLELLQDPGVPSKTASGSRDPPPDSDDELKSRAKSSSARKPKAKPSPKDKVKGAKAPKPAEAAKAPEPPAPVEPEVPPPPLPPPAIPPGSGSDSGEDVTSERQKQLIKEASSMAHKLTHIPKNPYCEICQRSRMYRQRVTKKRAEPLEDRGDLPPAEQFGERIATDYIIPSKREHAVHVIRDEYSGALRAFVCARTAERAAQNLLTFVGARYKHLPNVLCKADDAKELIAAVSQIGWVHEATLENRFPHNAQLEREIRTLEESTRAVHLAAGFHVVPDLWHVSVQFAAQTLTVVPWQGKDKSRFEVATGSPFEGPRLPLGQLVHYRIHDPSRRHKFEATTAPGLFAGWRFEHGFVYRDVIWVLDYEAVKSKSIGYRDMIPVPYAEVHVPETETFPLKAAADLALREFQDPKLEAITALDIPFSSLSPADPPRRRAEYITLERILKFGATPGCKACTFDSVKHSPKCRARFDALIKADRIALTSKPPEPVPPAELPEGVGLHPSSEPAVEGLVAKVELGVTQVFVDVNRERVRQRKVQTLIGKDVLFEYACGDSSELSQAASEIGINSIRLCRSMIDLSNEEHVKQVQGQVEASPGCDVWLSLPCTEFSPWQNMNVHRHGAKYGKGLRNRQEKSKLMFLYARKVLATAIANHGRIAVEWPKGSGWWDLPEWKEFQDEHGLHKVSFDGCMAGVKGREHPIRKPWSVATNDLRLVQFLGQLQCDGSHQHEAAEGSQTKQTEAYPRELAHNIVEAWYPQRYHRHIPSMVTKNLTKREWKADPRGVAAVKKEAEGLRSNGTWDDLTVCLLSSLRADAKRQNRKLKIAELLTLCGIKHFELPEHEHKFKGRIVYRGDCIFDQFGNHVLFEDVATTPTSLVALNIALFFGCQDGNAVSLADAIQAFLQADLAEAGEPDTWVILPEELWLDTWHKAYPSGSKLVVRLKRSLYGHPLAGKLWQKHLASVLTSFGGIEMDLFPSNFIFQMGSHTLLLNVYVDDLTLSGAKHLHAQFWKRLRAHIKLEDECYIEASNARILGRGHRIQRGSDFTTLVLDMSAFAEQVVEAYCELADVPKAKLRNVTTPSLSEALMSDEDLQQPGTLSHVAAKVLMKALWLGRLARPDLCFIIGRLASRVAAWTKWEDKQLLRLISYLHGTTGLCLAATVNHHEAPQIHIFTDSDFASCPHSAKSTSGIYMTIGSTDFRFPLWWASKKQTSVARSTPEAEAIAMASAMFGEALNIQVMMEHLLGRAIDVVFHQDNETLLKVLATGYSAKLRHCNRVHRVNVASMSEQLESPQVTAVYCKSESQIANGLTKVIPPAEWPHTLAQFGLTASSDGPHLETAVAALAEANLAAEVFAGSCPKVPTCQHLVQLLTLLPHGPDKRGAPGHDSHVFSAGAFVLGGVFGLQTNTHKFQYATALICRFFRRYMPSHKFSSIIVQQGVVAGLHRDSNNAEGSKNLLVALNPTSGPILWVEDEEGTVQCPNDDSLWGHMLCNPALFNPRARHCTVLTGCEASERIVAIAFLIRNAERLSPSDRATLLSAGFNLPSIC